MNGRGSNKRHSYVILEDHGYRDDSKAVFAIKHKFRHLDTSGNGMLEKDELQSFMPGLADEEIDALFLHMDIDGNNLVSFDEFVDFIFKPSPKAIEKPAYHGAAEVESLKQMKHVPPTPAHVRRKSEKIEFGGSMLYTVVNGEMIGSGPHNGHPSYEWSRKRRMQNKEPLERSDRPRSETESASLQGFSLARMGAGFHLFYGWTDDERTGWFIAESKPLVGEPVTDYVLFNPSPLAETPDICRAMWQTKEGERDRRLFCHEEVDAESDCAKVEVPEEELEDEELWGELSSDDEANIAETSWNTGWLEQSSETELAASDWDSDGFLQRNRYRMKIGEDARRAKQLAKEAKDLMVEEVEVEEVFEALPRTGTEELRQRRPRRKKEKKEIPGMTVRQAPGFQVKAVVKPAPTDHWARRRNKRSGDRTPSPTRNKNGILSSLEVLGRDDDDDPRIYEDGKFIDYEFPPGSASLGARMNEADGWMRLSDVNPQACLFYRIVPDDVFRQAFAGNVWFLSACAAAAEYPAWIRSMFGQRERISRSGRYKVRLFHPGKKKFVRVVIDDYVPTKGNSPVFGGITSDGEIWVALVEKAFAKLCGSYAQTQWGLHAHGLHYLCGGEYAGEWARNGPSRWRRSRTVWRGTVTDKIDREHSEGKEDIGDWRDEDEVWGLLRLAMERCYPLACGVDRDRAGTDENFGLQADRLYSVVGAREVPTNDGWFLRMVLIRNPYGVGKWEGRWSHYSEAWEENPKVREFLGDWTRDDGTFWMSFTDFEQYFEKIVLVRKSMPIQGSNKHKVVGIRRGLRKSLS